MDLSSDRTPASVVCAVTRRFTSPRVWFVWILECGTEQLSASFAVAVFAGKKTPLSASFMDTLCWAKWSLVATETGSVEFD